MRLWGRVAPLLTPWCSLGEVPSGVNLNWYAGWGSSIPWHCDNEPLFGDQSDAKVVVTTRASDPLWTSGCVVAGGAVLLLLLGWTMGYLLVMDGLAQSEYEHSTSSELQGPRVNLTYRWIFQHTPTCRGLRAGACWVLPSCVQGLPGLGPQGQEGVYSMPPLGWLFLWLVVVACLALTCASIAQWGWPCQRRSRACPRCPTLLQPVPLRGLARLIEGRRWKVPRGVDCPKGGIGNSPSLVKFPRREENWL